MLKMFRGRENGSRGGACRDSAQISRHLKEADTEALLDELMELTEAAVHWLSRVSWVRGVASLSG